VLLFLWVTDYIPLPLYILIIPVYFVAVPVQWIYSNREHFWISESDTLVFIAVMYRYFIWVILPKLSNNSTPTRKSAQNSFYAPQNPLSSLLLYTSHCLFNNSFHIYQRLWPSSEFLFHSLFNLNSRSYFSYVGTYMFVCAHARIYMISIILLFTLYTHGNKKWPPSIFK
jgi:hypothetical protein